MQFEELTQAIKIQPSIIDSGKFSQIRLLAEVNCIEDSSDLNQFVHHVTVKYEPSGFSLSREEISELIRLYKDKTYEGHEVQLFELESDSFNDVKTLNDSEEFTMVKSKNAKRKKVRSIYFTWISGLFLHAHVTRSCGCHTPVASKLACIAMQNNELQVTIPIQDSTDTVTYDISKPVEAYPKSIVHILDVFALP